MAAATAEQAENPRSRSAHLRAAVKIAAASPDREAR